MSPPTSHTSIWRVGHVYNLKLVPAAFIRLSLFPGVAFINVLIELIYDSSWKEVNMERIQVTCSTVRYILHGV